MLKGIAQANRVRETATKMLEDIVNRMKRSSTNKPQVSQKDEKPKDKYSEILARMNEFSQEMKGVRKELIEVKTSIATSPTTTEPTYAQALTRTPAPRATANMLLPEEKHRIEQEKKDRALYEITLSMRDATAETRELLTKGAREEIKAAFQNIINEWSPYDKPIIQAVNTLGTTTLKLHFRSKEETAKIRSLKISWDWAYEGVKVHNPQYDIVVHGVPTAAINDEVSSEELIKQWEEQNDIYNNLKITRITPLWRNNRQGSPATHKSMIVFMENASIANEIIMRGFFIDSQVLKAERYAPHLHINQCYHCHGFGHKSTHCQRKEKCGRCSKEDHRTNECNARKPHCANCKGDHEAWSPDCEKKTEESWHLHQMRTNSPALFSIW